MVAVTLSAGLVVLRAIDGRWNCLALRAYRNWDFPKGLVEPGETPFETALREASEETSLSAFEFPWGDRFRDTELYARGKIARFYLALSRDGEVRLPVSAELGKPEHHEFRWLPLESAPPILPPRLCAIVDWAKARIGTVT